MSTLEELLRLGLPSDAEVLAGASHLWREVTWVVRLRTRPPAIPPLAGGELVLVSIEALQALDTRPRLARIVDQLAELGAIGAAVVGPVATDAEQAAERNHFPLIQLPPTLRTDVLELELQRWLVQRKLDVQRELAQLYHELTQLVLAGGFPALLDRTVNVTRKPTLLQGVDWEVRMRRHPANSVISAEQVDAALAGSQLEAEQWINAPPPPGHERHLARIVLPKLHLVRLVAQVSDGRRPGCVPVAGGSADRVWRVGRWHAPGGGQRRAASNWSASTPAQPFATPRRATCCNASVAATSATAKRCPNAPGSSASI